MAASLPNEPDDLLITDELHHRIAHKADYQREKLAIQDLARQMAEQPDQVLPRLHGLQDQVFFAGTILLATTPISRAARHLGVLWGTSDRCRAVASHVRNDDHLL